MRTALKSGARVAINGVDYSIISLLSAGGGMSLIYEARQCVGEDGFAGRTVVKEFFPATGALRGADGRVRCASRDPADIERFEALRRGMIDEGVIGEDARAACSQVYAFDHAWDGYAVMRKLSGDTLSLQEILNAWQTAPPQTDEEYADMARLRYALRIAHSLLTGLQTIHASANIIHRDISLGNIVWASADFEKDGRDGRAYFLDFGSALRMDEKREARNTDDPLRLFGTYSFAAPEIWKLGGTLTPAADLFSVSAILLLLCCGKRCCIRMKPGWHLASQANAARLYESDFVVRSALEKLNVPADIRGRLMDLLLEGLSADPERRFGQSALNMLKALEALQLKCAPRQRLREYAAFISYNHRPLDKAVARRLHRQIEQYRIPAELVGDRKNRRLGLVFRDEDELPVSTDLTDNIQEALDHSDFLIVVCSPGTPKSIWVEQEISYFLRHHDRNHVLAVLAEGRPEESFPPHLRHLYDDAGNVVGETEYLAANIAGKSAREALKNLSRERLRIIAAMLGCPYDALAQREKRHQLQRIAAFAMAGMAVAMAFTGLLFLKNRQIEERNLQLVQQKREIQANESKLLVEDAREATENGDTTAALRLALAALPRDEADDRPYNPEAEKLLIENLGVLNKDYQNKGFLDSRPVEYGVPIDQFAIDASGDYLVALDGMQKLSVTNVHTGETVWEAGTPSQPREVATPKAHFVICDAHECVIVIYDSLIVCRALKDGREVWRYATDGMEIPVWSLSENGDRLGIVTDENSRFDASMEIIYDYSFIAFDVRDGNICSRVNLASGNDFWTLRFSELPSNNGDFHNGFFYNDELCFAGFYYEEDYSEIKVYTIDLTAQSFEIVYSQPVTYASKALHIGLNPSGSGLIMLFGSEDQQYAVELKCVDLNSGKLQWESRIEKATDKSVSLYPASCLLDGDKLILYSQEDTLYGLSKETGELRDSVSLYDAISSMEWVSEKKMFGFILADGYYALGWLNSTYGFVDSKSFGTVFQLEANHQSCMYMGGFIKPIIVDSSIEAFASGHPSEGFGYIVTQASENSTALNVCWMLPNVEFEKDDHLSLREDDYPSSEYVPAPVFRLFPEEMLLSERISGDSSYDYICTCVDRQTHAVLWRMDALSDAWKDLLPFKNGTGWMEVNTYGKIVRYDVEMDMESILAEDVDEELAVLYNEDRSNSLHIMGSPSSVSSTYLQSDGRLLAAWCDGRLLRWWLDGEEQRSISIPEDIHWSAHSNIQFFHLLQTCENGFILLSDYGQENEGEDQTERLYACDTRSGQWFGVDDAAHGSSERLIAMGEASARLAVIDVDDIIRVYDLEVEAIQGSFSMNIPGSYISEMRFVLGDHYLLLRTKHDHVMLIDAERGSVVYDGALEYHYDSNTIASQTRSGERVLLIDTTSREGILLDSRNWQPLGRMENVIGFDPETDELFFWNYNKDICIRRLPDLWEMIDMGRAIVGDEGQPLNE